MKQQLITLRVTKEENAEISKNAKEELLTKSAYIRRKLFLNLK
jgi:hypothetical protein